MKKLYSISLILILLLCVEQNYAQSIEDVFGMDNENVNDVEAPIDSLIYLFVILGSYLGFKKLK
ncbi:MAG: hypothetical protein ACQESK_10240 [Bacteroidota bacterium]